ncbi:hypothetical protein NDU88_002031 [Pleurodeles waltl]|uniref:Uncharacterized protein n=1 Tax=Pleurodeles waltl TaxID=8319 RepID=A0AAV7LEY6_PLEWA|nr:hypothetical protein NDU88_002031 [Pleurodeles waltl]
MLRPGADALAQALGGPLQAPRAPRTRSVFPAFGPPGATGTRALSQCYGAGEQDPGRQNVRADDGGVQSHLDARSHATF